MPLFFRPFENAMYPVSSQLRYFLNKDLLNNGKIKFASSNIGNENLIFQWNEEPLDKIAKKFKQYKQYNISDENVENFFETKNVVEDQPVWDLHDVGDDDDYKNDDRYPEEVPERLSPMQREKIAWYSPASFNTSRNYGIHFDAGAVLKVAKTLLDINGINSNISSNTSLVTAILISFWHEVCHAWIEDLTSIADYITGIDYYSYAVKKYNNYIFMEEALCNTAALGMLEVFFLNRFDIKDKEALFQKVISFMKSQPKGYRDFCRLKENWAAHDQIFLKNILRLLKRIYLIDHTTAFHALSIFFDPTEFTFPELKKISTKRFRENRLSRRHLWYFSGTYPFFGGIYMVSDHYPIHIHGIKLTNKGKFVNRKKTVDAK